jgi:hypothetical protein
MAAITTSNALTDFDMCLALAQVSIDTQMEYAWKAWKARKKFQDTLSIFKLKQRSGNIVDSPYGLSARLAPLTVSLTVPDAKIGQVQVNLHLIDGKVVYFDEEDGAKAEHSIDNWSVSFITDLDKKPVDLKALQQIDPAAAGVAQDVIASTGLPDSVFSIEYLFLKLTDVDLMLSDNKNVKIPDNVPSSARNKALSTLNLLLQGELGEYILGTVVRRNNRQATPTFALTDFVFDVQSNWSVPSASTLSYLGQLAGRGLPPDTSAARLKLRDAWVRPEQLDGREATVSGVMAIGKGVFLEKYLVPTIKEALRTFQFPNPLPNLAFGWAAGWEGPEPKRDRLTWTFASNVEGRDSYPDGVGGRKDLSVDQGYELAFTVQPSSNQLSITGRIWTKIHYDGYSGLSEGRAVWMYVDGHQNLSGTMSLVDNGIGADFNLESRLDYTVGDPVVDNNEVGGLAKLWEAFGSALKGLGIIASSPSELLGSAQRQVGDEMQTHLRESLQRLDTDLRQHTFIPPGGGVFTFQNPRFSNAGDLFFEVIYRSP